MPIPRRFQDILKLNRFPITHETYSGESPYDPEPEEVRNLVEVGNRFRGNLINETVYIEDKLEKYLAKHFHNDPKKGNKLPEEMSFDQKLKEFRSTPAANNFPGLRDDLSYLNRLRNTLAHGKLIFEHRTGELKIYNARHSRTVILTKALRAEIEEKVSRVEESLNRLFV